MMNLEDALKRARSAGTQAARNVKTAAYGVVGTVERGLQERQGVIGVVADVVEDASERAKVAHQGIQEQGGYKAVAQNVLNGFAQRADATYTRLEEVLFTDGKYDAAKAKALAAKARTNTEQFGRKAATYISYLASKGASVVEKDMRKHVPDLGERNRKYPGIGTEYEGVLFRQHLEGCLSFYRLAQRRIPSTVRSRPDVLADIKASANVDNAELLGFYGSRLDDPKTTSKVNVANQYLR